MFGENGAPFWKNEFSFIVKVSRLGHLQPFLVGHQPRWLGPCGGHSRLRTAGFLQALGQLRPGLTCGPPPWIWQAWILHQCVRRRSTSWPGCNNIGNTLILKVCLCGNHCKQAKAVMWGQKMTPPWNPQRIKHRLTRRVTFFHYIQPRRKTPMLSRRYQIVCIACK